MTDKILNCAWKILGVLLIFAVMFLVFFAPSKKKEAAADPMAKEIETVNPGDILQFKNGSLKVVTRRYNSQVFYREFGEDMEKLFTDNGAKSVKSIIRKTNTIAWDKASIELVRKFAGQYEDKPRTN